jgi:hypothetical protein
MYAPAAARYCSALKSNVTFTRHAGEERLLDRRQALLGARNLDEQVRAVGSREQLGRRLDRALRVVCEPRRHLERHPAVDAVGAIPNTAEQVGGGTEVVDRQIEEDVLGRASALRGQADRIIVGVACLERMVEDRGVRREPRDPERVDVPL